MGSLTWFDGYLGTFNRSFVSLSYLDSDLTLTYLQDSHRLKTSRIFSTPLCKYDAEQATFESTFKFWIQMNKELHYLRL